MADKMGEMVDDSFRWFNLSHFLSIQRPNLLGKVPAVYFI